MNQKENIQRFLNLMNTVQREGKDELIRYISEKTDFYFAPASTNFHLACEGGLLQHSLNVYNCLVSKKNISVWKKVFDGITDESLIIMSLLHDLCKANFYIKTHKNQKTYDSDKIAAAQKRDIKHDDLGDYVWETVERYQINDNDQTPLGHGEKSCLIIQGFMKLRMNEVMAIRWHMGFSEDKSQYYAIGSAMEKYPIVLALYEADLEASKLLEDVSRNKEFLD